MQDSVAGLMDTALPPEEVARIEAIIAATRGPTNDIHELRTRHAGRLTFIDFSLRVPGTMSVDDSHAVCDDLEEALRREFHESSIRSEEHTSELQSLMRISYAVFCLKK